MKRRKAILYGIYWVIYLLSILSFSQAGQSANMLLLATGQIFLSVVLFILVAEGFMPRILQSTRLRWLWIVGMILTCVLIAGGSMGFHLLILQDFRSQIEDSNPYLLFFEYFLESFWFMVSTAGVSFGHWWYETQLKAKEIAHLQTQAELSLLRYRVNPHFLFNTLNNLYAFALEKSEETPQIILQLSGLMRYMLRHEKELIPLASELEYLGHYLSLERLRLGNSIGITMHVQGNPDGLYITPMVLLPFVENAFKHGVSRATWEGYVEIQAHIKDDELYFYVENSKPLYVAKDITLNGVQYEAQGLNTVKRRLELLYGKDRYKLEIVNNKDKYAVNLHMRLSQRM